MLRQKFFTVYKNTFNDKIADKILVVVFLFSKCNKHLHGRLPEKLTDIKLTTTKLYRVGPKQL